MRCSIESGQGTVEAAVLLPLLLLVLGLLVQPAILFYDKAVMRSAAAESCRLVATNTARDVAVEEFARRRLASVPNVDAFHVGGARSWEVSWEGPDEAGGVRVRIAGRVRMLPLFGVAAGLGGAKVEHGEVELAVEERSSTRPAWAQGAGSPQEWIGAWE